MEFESITWNWLEFALQSVKRQHLLAIKERRIDQLLRLRTC